MSPRKTILRELDRLRQERGSDEYAEPRSLSGFDANDGRFTTAINELLQDRLINGVKGPSGGMAVALNESRLADVRRELRPWYASPAVWTTVTVAVALGAFALL